MGIVGLILSNMEIGLFSGLSGQFGHGEKSCQVVFQVVKYPEVNLSCHCLMPCQGPLCII